MKICAVFVASRPETQTLAPIAYVGCQKENLKKAALWNAFTVDAGAVQDNEETAYFVSDVFYN